MLLACWGVWMKRDEMIGRGLDRLTSRILVVTFENHLTMN